MTTVHATAGTGSDRPQEVSYTDAKVIGNGSFGVVYQAKLVDTNELVAIKKVLQDKRFKVRKGFYKIFILMQVITVINTTGDALSDENIVILNMLKIWECVYMY